MAIKIGIIIYEGCTASMIVGVLDILSLANAQQKSLGGADLFTIEVVSETGEPVNSFSQFQIKPERSIKSKIRYDLIYVPGFLGNIDETLTKQTRIIGWLKTQYEKGSILTAACNGNFLLAASGMLDGKKASTHWSLITTFRDYYQAVTLEPEKIIVDNGDIISAAGVTACFNLALFIIERYGDKDLALVCAKVFLVDSGRRIQTPYKMYQVSKNHGDDEILMVQNWLEDKYKEKVTLEDMMDVCHLGKKTLIRRFKKVTGETPLLYLQKLRIENAKRILESKRLSFNEITWEVGYNDVSAFHRTFKSETGLTPMEYRSKFSIV